LFPVFLALALVYLVIAPGYLFATGSEDAFPLAFAVMALAATITGGWLASFLPKSSKRVTTFPPLRRGVDVLAGVACIIYIGLSLTYGLYDRRVGFYAAIDRALTMPTFVQVMATIVEDLLFPFAIIRLCAWQIDGQRRPPLILAALMTAAWLSMGALDSRLLAVQPLLLLLIFFILPRVGRDRSRRVVGIVGILSAGVFLAAAGAASSANQSTTNISTQIATRLNGYELLTMLEERGFLSATGNWKFEMFEPATAQIPVLPDSQEYKSQGLTSSKAYLLQRELGYARYDAVAPVTLDPYVFGGSIGLVVCMALIGMLLRATDLSLRNATWTLSPIRMSFVLALGLMATSFESQLSGLLVSSLRLTILIWLMVRLVLVWPDRRGIDVAEIRNPLLASPRSQSF
jgi:hypothetical protein